VVSGQEILNRVGLNWWYGIHWKSGRTGQHMKNDEGTRQSIQHTVATILSLSAENVIINPNINARGDDPTHHTGRGDAIMFHTYTIGYQFRRSVPIEERYFDQTKYNQAISHAQYYIDSSQQKITQFQQKEAAEKLQQQKAQALVIKQQQEAALKLKHEEEEGNTKIVVSTNEKDRAELFIRLYAKRDDNITMCNFIFDKIKELGFDANHLAYLSMQQNHKVLFELSLQRGADCDNCFVEGRTLLQHLIHSKNDLFIQKAFVQCKDLSTTAISAIEQNDVLSITKVVAHDSNLLKQKYDGYSLLQTAIIKNASASIVELILELDNTCLDILSDNGESALKLALISGNPEIIQLFVDRINLVSELNQLVDNTDPLLREKILEKNDIEALIKLLKGEEITLQQYLVSCGEVIEKFDLIPDLNSCDEEVQELGINHVLTDDY
jgi:hypothetical protein